MRLVLRGLWNQYRPPRRGESDLDYCRRRYPHITIPTFRDPKH